MNTLGLVNVLNNDGNVLIDVAQMVDSHIQNAAIHNALSICHMYGRYINSLATILFPILDNCDILMCILAEQAGNRKYQTSTLQKPLSRKLRIWNLGENARLRCSVIFVAPNFLVMEISEQRNS